MTVLSVIGVSALYLLYGWLLSAIVASWLSGKKGYGERIGLACGLLLSFVAVIVWIAVPSKPTSDWGRRRAARGASRPSVPPPAAPTGGEDAAAPPRPVPTGGDDAPAPPSG